MQLTRHPAFVTRVVVAVPIRIVIHAVGRARQHRQHRRPERVERKPRECEKRRRERLVPANVNVAVELERQEEHGSEPEQRLDCHDEALDPKVVVPFKHYTKSARKRRDEHLQNDRHGTDHKRKLRGGEKVRELDGDKERRDTRWQQHYIGELVKFLARRPNEEAEEEARRAAAAQVEVAVVKLSVVVAVEHAAKHKIAKRQLQRRNDERHKDCVPRRVELAVEHQHTANDRDPDNDNAKEFGDKAKENFEATRGATLGAQLLDVERGDATRNGGSALARLEILEGIFVERTRILR